MTSRRMFTLLSCFTFALAGCSEQAIRKVSAQESAESEGFALVELFTSQGCSSCPSADKNLARIAAEVQKGKLPVYTLSFHVDYWNRLGWKDPFSMPEFSERQRRYARQVGSQRVYTPQMIVNGKTEFVGSSAAKSNRAVNEALRSAGRVRLDVQPRAEGRRKVSIAWKVAGAKRTDVLHLALVQNEAARSVTSGENAGRDLRHVNVVRSLRSLKSPDLTGTVELIAPAGFSPDRFHVVGYLQTSDLTIRGANRGDFSAANKSPSR